MQAGEVFAGRFMLAEQLGSGSMGEVWRATDRELDRLVAVKVLHLAGGNPSRESVERFRREGKAIARLEHPHVARVYDVGEHEGRPFLVLELLIGPDLETLLEQHPGGLPVEEAVDYAIQAVEGLTAAHDAGVIHRDVKPANLILDEHGHVRVCDFGVARLEGATTGLSMASPHVGTPDYMAPEQVIGEAITPAADLYALGATLFHLLTGRPPFPGDDIRSVFGQHLYKDPPAVGSLRPDVPAGVDACVRAMLAKDPADRPPAEGIAARLRTPHTLQNRVLSLLAKAEQAARTITSPSSQGHLLRYLAQEIVTRDPAEAERVARTITDPAEQRKALQDIAEAVARRDVAEAERIIGLVPGPPGYQAEAMARLAEVLAEEDPAEAIRVARNVPDPYPRAMVTARIAEAVAARDAARAGALLAEAERAARTIPNPYHKAFSFGQIAVKAASQDRGRAAAVVTETLRLIQTMPDADKEYGSPHIAKLLAEVFPDEAEQIVDAIQPARADAYTDLAAVIAARNPGRAMTLLSKAQRVARSETDPDYRASLLQRAVEVIASLNLAEARQGARAITVPAEKARATVAIAKAAAGQDPQGAATLLAEAEDISRGVSDPTAKAEVLTRIATTMSTIDPAGAVRIARTIADPRHRTWALQEIVEEMSKTDIASAQRAAATVAASGDQGKLLHTIVRAAASRDPAEAERVARTISDPEYRIRALTSVAWAISGRDHGRADALLVEAEHLADTISDADDRADVLLAIARAASKS
jgi:hypothetical protein